MISKGIILTPDERSKAYIQKISNNDIFLDEILFLNDNRKEKKFSFSEIEKSKEYNFDISESVKETLEKNNLKYTEFNFVDINNPQLVNFLKKSKIDCYFFSGGGILKKEILNTGCKFVHFHPGFVPNYRGSTCFYYSILNENNCGVTAYFMDEKLDSGDIIFQKIFPKPIHFFLDDIFDPHIRSETLLIVLKQNLLEKSTFQKQNLDSGETYFIIHPVLKHISILSCI